MAKKQKRRRSDDGSSSASDRPPAIVAYEAWLRKRGVQWDDAVGITNVGVAAGWGCIARRRISKGAKLFRVPAAACFGARSRKPGADPDGKDSQQREAARLLAEYDKGGASEWEPLLAMLSATPARHPRFDPHFSVRPAL